MDEHVERRRRGRAAVGGEAEPLRADHHRTRVRPDGQELPGRRRDGGGPQAEHLPRTHQVEVLDVLEQQHTEGQGVGHDHTLDDGECPLR